MDFTVEIVIGDDFSQDQSLEIAKSYKNQGNFIFNVLKRPLGGDYFTNRQEKKQTFNFADILSNCKGKYIALLDGDDYWSDSKKLAVQVQYLENNQATSICCHGSEVIHEGIRPPNDNRKTFYDIPKTGNFEFSLMSLRIIFFIREVFYLENLKIIIVLHILFKINSWEIFH